MSKEQESAPLGTADLLGRAQPARTQVTDVDAREVREDSRDVRADAMAGGHADPVRSEEESASRRPAGTEPLAALFAPETAQDFRSRWDEVQIGFVDDPRQAVRKADELVAQVMKNLAQQFADERAKFESQFDEKGSASTENLRVALRGYRSFFQRLLSL